MDVALAIEHQTGFTLDLFKTYVAKNEGKDHNALMSPVSIATAVAMVGAGAQGATLAEITSVLKLPEGEAMHQFTSQIRSAVFQDGSASGGPFLSFANGLWVDKSLSLKPKFEERVTGNYGGAVKAADFGTKAEDERTAINSWVLEETKGKIEDLLPIGSLNESTRMVLANALYFKGSWAKKFETSDTKNEDFYLLNGETVNVPFLSSDKKQYIRKFDTHKVLRLPYAKGEDSRSFSMYIVLPNDKGGLAEVEKNLDAKSLATHLNWASREVKVGKFLLPKFKICAEFQVAEALISLGLKAAFSPGANFSDMTEGPSANLLCLSDVFHKSFIEINEEGTVAAAATAAVMMLKSIAIGQPEDFVADHPFLFILREDVTGLILFIGHITNPSLLD